MNRILPFEGSMLDTMDPRTEFADLIILKNRNFKSIQMVDIDIEKCNLDVVPDFKEKILLDERVSSISLIKDKKGHDLFLTPCYLIDNGDDLPIEFYFIEDGVEMIKVSDAIAKEWLKDNHSLMEI